MKIANIHLGKLEACKGYEGLDTFWAGFIKYPFYLNCEGEPDELLSKFVKGIMVKSESYLGCARSFLQLDIVENHEKYNASQETVVLLKKMSQPELPFDLPEFTFYQNKEWQVRFASGGLLPAFGGLGVSVSFVDENPVGAECLSK
ncbi:MAG: hypothetical protein K6L75_14045 [Cellvibrionaceae bacterium]